MFLALLDYYQVNMDNNFKPKLEENNYNALPQEALNKAKENNICPLGNCCEDELLDSSNITLTKTCVTSSLTKDSNEIGFLDLPEATIFLILVHLSPQDIAHGACACTTFRDTFQANCVWKHRCPMYAQDIIEQLAYEIPRTLKHKQTFNLLCNGVPLGSSGKRVFWLDAKNGAPCYEVSARGLNIAWGDNGRYWEWILGHQGSRWPEVAYVRNICWFQVTGALRCILPKGSYTLSWRLQLCDGPHSLVIANSRDHHSNKNTYGWASAPAKFAMSFTDGSQSSTNERYLTNHPENHNKQNELVNLTPVRVVDHNWLEYDAGEIDVVCNQEEFSLMFSVMEAQSGRWKSGLKLDSVVLRPTFLTKQIGKYGSTAHLGKLWKKKTRATYGKDVGHTEV